MTEPDSVINLDDFDLENNEGVQYVYDENGVNIGSINSEDISEVMLADGTKAVLINGAMLPCLDSQSIVLEDGQELNQYYINDESINQTDQEDFLNDTADTSDVVQYMQSNDSNIDEINSEHQIVYINDEIYGNLQENTSSGSELQIAEIQDEENGILINTDQFEDGTIDFNQLLNQQMVVRTDNLGYQYAILKDGKLHLQTLENCDFNNEVQFATSDSNESTIVNSNTLVEKDDALDVSSITGRDLITGETVSLDSYINKLKHKQYFNYKRSYTKNKVPAPRLKKRNVTHNNYYSSNKGINSLVNKKIPLGQTEDGKMLIGKILTIRKKDQKEVKTEKTDGIVTINLDSDSEDMTLKNVNQELVLPIKKNMPLNTNVNSTIIAPSISDNLSPFEGQVDDVRRKKHKSHLLIQNNASEVGQSNLPDQKILIHEKLVTKECFQHISRTLAGLMNMESVRRKLTDKSLVVKVVEKIYNEDIKGYTKKVMYSSGYMVEETVLEEDDEMTEKWKFVPDNNTKEALFGLDNDNTVHPTTNITIIITLEKSGERVIRVLLNPSSNSAYRCRLCFKGFRTRVHLRLHMSTIHQNNGVQMSQEDNESDLDESYIFECDECNKKFNKLPHLLKHKDTHNLLELDCPSCTFRSTSEEALQKHLLSEHCSTEEFRCEVCLKTFTNFGDLNFHKRTHIAYRYFSCKICGRAFSRQSNLQRHVAIHKGDGALYRCDICDCSYHYISSLTRHVVQNHIDLSRNINSQSTEMDVDETSSAVGNIYPVSEEIEESIM